MSPEESNREGRKPPVNPPTDVEEPSPVRSPDKPVPEEPPEPQEVAESEAEEGGGEPPLGAAGRSDSALEP